MTETKPSGTLARRLYGLTEPIAIVPYAAPEPTAEVMALGYRNYWDTYFAGRAAPLGRCTAEVVHALFYNFADGEVARHIPHVWDIATPEAVLAARERGCAAAVRRILADLADSPGVTRAADLATKAATSAPTEGRAMYAGLRTLPIPDEPVARLWHSANLLRSTAATVTSPRWSRRASAGSSPTRCMRCPRACLRRSSAGSTTCPPRHWPLWPTGCAAAASSTTPAGSPTPDARSGNGSRLSPTTSRHRPTTS